MIESLSSGRTYRLLEGHGNDEVADDLGEPDLLRPLETIVREALLQRLVIK